jgi:hypothetical protein
MELGGVVRDSTIPAVLSRHRPDADDGGCRDVHRSTIHGPHRERVHTDAGQATTVPASVAQRHLDRHAGRSEVATQFRKRCVLAQLLL